MLLLKWFNKTKKRTTSFKKRNHFGFTLIELLIAMSIFSVVVVGFLELFGSAFKEQGKNLNKVYLLNNVSYVAEYMGRALRMAKKDLGGVCITSKYNFETPSASHIKFLNYKGECQEFFLEDKILKVKKLGFVQDLTPSNIEVENLKFFLVGEGQEDDLQPRVTFAIKLKNKEELLDFQTTISQRDLDVKY